MKKLGNSRDFDPLKYWSERLLEEPNLRGTGKKGLPIKWQQWCYKGRERAFFRILGRNDFRIRGSRILNFGCGTGYFEDLFERCGAEELTGIDFVEHMIRKLKRANPSRRYICADISENPSSLKGLNPHDLVTAIDVLYHIVDDNKLLRTLKELVGCLKPGGYFLFNDVFQHGDVHVHVCRRDFNKWIDMLEGAGLEYIDKEPVFILGNLRLRGLNRFPGLIGAVQHYLDTLLLRTLPYKANSYALLTKRK